MENRRNLSAAVYTLGCKVNQYESRAIEENLSGRGYEIRSFTEICDLYIVNTCAVTAESSRKSCQIIRRAIHLNPRAVIAVCGCQTEFALDLIKDIGGVDVIAGASDKVKMIDSVDTVCVNGVKPDEPIILTETFKKADKTLNEPHIHKFGRTRAYVKIEDGCGNKCSYCIIPKLRGGVRYKPADEVYAEISELADNGCAEVSLIGIEISSYPSLPDLVKKLDKISGIKRIRLGSLDPSYIKPQIADGLFASGKIMPHFHLSAQCGSDRILALMRRRYTAETIINNIRYLRSRRPETNISFDIIVGFPSETDSDFSDTAELIKLTAPLHTHIFTFSPREGTEAAVMQGQIPESEKIKRSAALAEIQAGIKRTIYDAALNKSEPLSVLFESFNAGSGIVTGHTPNFLEVSVSGEKSLCGMIHSVRPLGLQPKKENIYGEIIK